MSEFLLEILAEEIPAAVISTARGDLLQAVAKALAAERINGTFYNYSPLRRLILVGKMAARDAGGRGSRCRRTASVGRARLIRSLDSSRGGIRSRPGSGDRSLTVTTTPKGKYVVARKTIEGVRRRTSSPRSCPPSSRR